MTYPDEHFKEMESCGVDGFCQCGSTVWVFKLHQSPTIMVITHEAIMTLQPHTHSMHFIKASVIRFHSTPQENLNIYILPANERSVNNYND